MIHAVKRVIAKSTWAEIRTAYASGIGLRELARNMNIPAGTVLARAKREDWTRQIHNAKALTVRPAESSTVTPTAGAALSLRARGERHVERMAGVTERVLPHLEGMKPDEILSRVDQVEKLDKIARRTFGLNDSPMVGISLDLGAMIQDMR